MTVAEFSKWLPFLTSTHSVSNDRTLRMHLFLSGEEKSTCRNIHISKMASVIPIGMKPKYCSVCVTFNYKGRLLTDEVLAEIVIHAESVRAKYLVNLAEHKRQQARTKEEVAAAKKMVHRKKLLSRHKMTITEYNILVDRQGNKCAICGTIPSNGKNLAVDHDHRTGLLRGLLCSRCNTAIARLGDDLAGVQRAVDYLSRC